VCDCCQVLAEDLVHQTKKVSDCGRFRCDTLTPTCSSCLEGMFSSVTSSVNYFRVIVQYYSVSSDTSYTSLHSSF
ncbi:hypothetical protein L9F63_016974, partial [Diploptera punctata]